MTLKVSRFLDANARSPVVYFGLDASGCTYRLADGTAWRLNRREARAIGHPRWAHLPASNGS